MGRAAGLTFALLALFVAGLVLAPGAASASSVAGSVGQTNLAELAARLQDGDSGTRRNAARRLGEDGSAEAIALLGDASNDSDRRVRRAAIDALVSLRRTETAAALIRFLGDENKDNRSEVIRGLVEMHGSDPPAGAGTRTMNWLMRREEEFVLDPLRPVTPEVVNALSSAFSDRESDVRRLTAEAIGALRAESALDALVTAASTDMDQDVRREAVEALGMLGGDTAGESLVGLLDQPSVAREVVRALSLMAYDPAAPAILALYDADPESDQGRDALEGLARMGYPGARGTFYHELGSRDARRREYAAEGLGRLDDPTLVDGLIRDFLREDDGRVQLAYCFALVRLGQTPFVDRIVLSLDDRGLRDVARQYALELGRGLLTEFLGYLEDPDRDIRLEIIALVERIGDPEAIPALTAASADEDEEVAARAELAVQRLSAR